MAKRPCLDCGTPSTGSRCGGCTATHNAQRWQAKGGRYNGTWRTEAPRRIAAHRAQYGDRCPGWQRTPHASTDLVVDHDAGVMCRSCNGVKAATFDKQRR